MLEVLQYTIFFRYFGLRSKNIDSLQRRRVNTSPEDGHRDRIDRSDFRGVARITERGIVVEMSDADAEGEWSRIIEAEPDICYKNFTAKSSRSKRAGPFEGGV